MRSSRTLPSSPSSTSARLGGQQRALEHAHERVGPGEVGARVRRAAAELLLVAAWTIAFETLTTMFVELPAAIP